MQHSSDTNNPAPRPGHPVSGPDRILTPASADAYTSGCTPLFVPDYIPPPSHSFHTSLTANGAIALRIRQQPTMGRMTGRADCPRQM